MDQRKSSGGPWFSVLDSKTSCYKAADVIPEEKIERNMHIKKLICV